MHNLVELIKIPFFINIKYMVDGVMCQGYYRCMISC